LGRGIVRGWLCERVDNPEVADRRRNQADRKTGEESWRFVREGSCSGDRGGGRRRDQRRVPGFRGQQLGAASARLGYTSLERDRVK
jgi:hypothetical protein